MCVKLVRNNIPCSFDTKSDFLDQTRDCTEVIVQYVPGDKELKKFLQEIQKCAKNGTHLNFSVKVNYDDYLAGFKTKKDIKRAMNDISLNEVVKLMTLTQHVTEKKLEEISSICLNREVDGK